MYNFFQKLEILSTGVGEIGFDGRLTFIVNGSSNRKK